MNPSNLIQYASVESLRQLHESYEYHLSALAVLAGFTIDSLTLRRVDLWAEHIVIISYLVIAALAIIVMLLHNEGRLQGKIFKDVEWWTPLVMQFAFGGLFSVFLLFYGRASAIAANWPALIILLGLLVGNEFFRRRYRRLTFNLSVWYTAVLAYCIFAVPILVNQIGNWVFVLSGLSSLLVVAGFVRLLKTVSSSIISSLQRTFAVSIGAVLLFTGVLYFSHAIPPIPLSLQETSVAHNITRLSDGSYQLSVEDEAWYRSVMPGETIHLTPSGSAYLFSSVFAPTGFDTQLVHDWQYHQNDKWVSISRVSFPVIGGRDGGYRGYSKKTNLQPGDWRVLVKTGSGRLVGRDGFHIELVNQTPQLRSVNR